MVCPYGQEGSSFCDFVQMFLWTAPCFFNFLPLNLLFVRSHQAEIIIVKYLIPGRNHSKVLYPKIIIVKYLIPGRNNVSQGWELNQYHAIMINRCSKKGALTLSAILPIICSILGEARITRISVKGGAA